MLAKITKKHKEAGNVVVIAAANARLDDLRSQQVSQGMVFQLDDKCTSVLNFCVSLERDFSLPFRQDEELITLWSIHFEG